MQVLESHVFTRLAKVHHIQGDWLKRFGMTRPLEALYYRAPRYHWEIIPNFLHFGIPRQRDFDPIGK